MKIIRRMWGVPGQVTTINQSNISHVLYDVFSGALLWTEIDSGALLTLHVQVSISPLSSR